MIESKRIKNLEFCKASYLLPEDQYPENPSYNINYYYPNSYYGKEKEFIKKDDWYIYPDMRNCRVHKDLFKCKECNMAIASFDYDSHEDFYELHFVGDRPINIPKEEREIFWELIQYGNEQLNKKEE